MSGIIIAMLVVGGVGLFIGLFLGVAAIRFKVQVGEKEVAVLEVLPGNNCGGCGYPGCSGFASAMVEGDTDEFKCRPCKADKKKEIIDYLKNTPGPDGKTVTIKG